MRFRTVIFDLDDTLYPEWSFVRSGFRAVERFVRSNGLHTGPELASIWYSTRRSGQQAVFDEWIANGDSEVVEFASRLGGPARATEIMIEVFRHHRPEIAPFEGVPALLGELHNRVGVTLGLVSDGEVDTQMSKLKALGLDDAFGAVVVSGELGVDYWKPSPAPFHEVLRRLGRSTGDSVYVADNPMKDFLGARLAGLWSIRYRSPDGVYCECEAPSEAHKPDLEVSSVSGVRHQLFAGSEP